MENGEKPRAMKSAIAMLWLVLAIGFLTFVAGFDSYRMEASVERLGLFFFYMLVFTIFVVDIFPILYISAGRTWARMIKLVLCIVGIGQLFSISGIRDTFVASPSIPIILNLIPVVQGILSVVVVCLLFSGSANRWFDQGVGG
jgi:hypothetical protein